jgi:hypothetical protein
MTSGAQDRAIATLQVWLDAHGDVSVAANILQVHPQTVRYRLGGLREVFGDGGAGRPRRATRAGARASGRDGLQRPRVRRRRRRLQVTRL